MSDLQYSITLNGNPSQHRETWNCLLVVAKENERLRALLRDLWTTLPMSADELTEPQHEVYVRWCDAVDGINV